MFQSTDRIRIEESIWMRICSVKEMKDGFYKHGYDKEWNQCHLKELLDAFYIHKFGVM